MKESFNEIAKALFAKFAGHEAEEEERRKQRQDVGNLNRLHQISDRRANKVAVSNNVKIEFDSRMREAVVRQEEKRKFGALAVTHWCGDNGRHLSQEIRTGEQLRGVAKGFEIDPIMGLSD